MHIVDRVVVIMEISKAIEKNCPCIHTEGKLEIVKKFVATFESRFDQRQRVGLLGCWSIDGNLLPCENCEHKLKIPSVEWTRYLIKL